MMNQQVLNTGKVKIGIYYDKPTRSEQDKDAELIQRALLAKGKSRVDWDKVMLIAAVFGVSFLVFAGMAGWLPGGQ
jgi:hypothetical protein